MSKYKPGHDGRQAAVIPLQNAAGRICAGLRLADAVVQKDIAGSKHFLRQPPAICFDEWTLGQADNEAAARGLEVAALEVRDVESGRLYRSTAANFRANAFEIDRGGGQQLALALRYWSVGGQPAEGAAPAESCHKMTTPEPQQLSLFERRG